MTLGKDTREETNEILVVKGNALDMYDILILPGSQFEK